MNIFVTGCCGYIGSHTTVELLEKNFNVIGLDNFSNSSPSILKSIKQITGKDIVFYEGDMLDEKLLQDIFSSHKIDIVIDFAAFKSVGDSVNMPIEYYINNVSSVLTLLKVMKSNDIKSLVFSSSANVYGNSKIMPVTETCEVGGTTNPYGTSKLFVEKILEDLYKSDNSFNLCIFRYFNPVGAHRSHLIGETPNGIPPNLMPYVVKVATKELECLSIYGDDYDTSDGTGVRDYIHIVDLAKAHVAGVEKLIKSETGKFIYNLGTGKGTSVLEMVKTFEKVNGLKLNYKITERRPSDIGTCFADCSLAEKELNWKADLTVEDMCYDCYQYEIKKTR